MFSLSVADHVRFKTKRGHLVTALPITAELGKFIRGDKSTRSANFAEWKRLTAAGMDIEQVMTPSDLLHAVVALYGTSFPDQTLQTLYKTLCEEGSRTLFLLRDTSEILNDWESQTPNSLSAQSRENSDVEINNNPVANPLDRDDHFKMTSFANGEKHPHLGLPTQDNEGNNVTSPSSEEWRPWIPRNRRNEVPRNLQDILGEKNGEVSAPSFSDGGRSDIDRHAESPFSDIFSDQSDLSDSTSDMEEEEDQDDLSRGLDTFLRSVASRRLDKQIAQERYSLQSTHVGIEHRLLASATFQKNYRIPGTKVVFVSLLAVRKRYRKCGIGKFLLKRIKNPSCVGPYDALVVTSENIAIEFFRKNGFTDDLILSSRFRELTEKSDNCTLMCYLPPFDGHYPPLPGVNEWNRPEAVVAMDDEIERWRQKSLEAYQAQVTCLTRLQQEVLRLRGLLRQQESAIVYLKKENHKLQSRLGKAERKSTQALIQALEKETENFERMCTIKISQSEER